MEDFIELGIEGADKLVDKHFHRVPDKALRSQTYNPREIRRKHRRRRRLSPSSPESEIEPPPSMSQDPRQGSFAGPPAPEYAYAPYSRDAPHLRPEYAPSSPQIGQPYFPPPPQLGSRAQGRRYEEDDDGDDEYDSDRRRRTAVTRRSSSYHGPRSQDDYYDERQQVQRRRRGSSRDGLDTRSRDGGHHGLKEEVEKHFTHSRTGITGAVAGAVVGGWAAKKAQDASRGHGGKHHGSNPLLTLLGAAAGGLVVNAVIDKLEDRKRENEDKDLDRAEKWDSEDDERDDRSERKGRRDSGYSRRQRSRSYSSDREN